MLADKPLDFENPVWGEQGSRLAGQVEYVSIKELKLWWHLKVVKD